jgi:phage replication-related protein YjqB (UPF0714/DUF867 family)
MEQPWRDFSELILHTTKEVDYHVVVVERSAALTVAAIHGGTTEPLTSALAAAIAADQHNLYDFRGLCTPPNLAMRVPVGGFGDLRLQSLMSRSQVGLSIQGGMGSEEAVRLGGRNAPLAQALQEALSAAGFAVCPAAPEQAAAAPNHFYNLPREGGAQLELTLALRQALCDDLALSRPNARFGTFVGAVRAGLERYQAARRDDLGAAMAHFERTTVVVKRHLGLDGSHEHHEN